MIARALYSLLAALLFVSCLVPAASAHVRDSKGRWLFTGSTYGETEIPPRKGHRADPLAVIWGGPRGTTADGAEVKAHTEHHWDDARFRSGWENGERMKPRGSKLCTTPQWVFMRRAGQNDGDYQISHDYMSTDGGCTDQYHIRMFGTTTHGNLLGNTWWGEWTLTTIHHETSCKKGSIFHCRKFGHRPDMAFDDTRVIYYKTMTKIGRNGGHCGVRHWNIHPESQDELYAGKYKYSGVISRVSFRERPGC